MGSAGAGVSAFGSTMGGWTGSCVAGARGVWPEVAGIGAAGNGGLLVCKWFVLPKGGRLTGAGVMLGHARLLGSAGVVGIAEMGVPAEASSFRKGGVSVPRRCCRCSGE